ncbi:MAG: phosphatidylglycerophosphatase A [Candidatus Pelagibacter bacterium]|jgi:phosphatidylglycerophosphatase A|nr:phosphatidylglycerophosphatase A [Candidatus Pelagibacter bacterium]
MINKINLFFVTFFGIGYVKFAPGSFASLITSILLFISFHILNISSNIVLIFLFFIFFYSLYAISSYIKKISNKDPKEVVIDEVIGQSIPIYLYEISHGTSKQFDDALVFYTTIFILFRLFDIIKPFPVSYFDKKFKNSFGVIFDDICAGLYVVLILVLCMVLK